MPAKESAPQEPGASRRRRRNRSGDRRGDSTTDHERAEEALMLSHRFLEIANRHVEKVPLLEELVGEIQGYTGCAAVAIRMLDEDGNIPYEAYIGFSKRFYELESPLSIKSDQCMCINVIKGQTDPKLPFYTEGGSFYMNATTRFLATVSEEEKGKTRNVCNEFGYESVALIPIRLVGRILGVIHVADTREDMVPLAMVEVLEGTVAQVGTAIQRVRAEEALRTQRDKLEGIIASVGDGLDIVNRDYRVHFQNEMLKDRFGDLTGKLCYEGYMARETPCEACPMDKAIATGRTQTVEMTGADGRQYEVTSTPFQDIDGETRVIEVCRDITERKLAEEEIEKLAKFPSENPHPILRVAEDGTVLYANAQGELLLVDRGSGAGRRAPPQWCALVADVMRSGSEKRIEAGWADRTFAFRIVPIARAGYANWYGVDITERKQAEEALRLAARRWQTTFDGVAEAVCLLDADARIVQCNRAMGEMAGKQPAECVRRNCCELVHGSPHHLEGCPLVAMRSSLRRETLELAVGQRWLQVTVDPLTDEAGNLTGAVHVVSDITERTLAEKALRRSEERYRDLVEGVDDLVTQVDGEGRFTFVNHVAREVFGLEPRQCTGLSAFDFVHPEDRERTKEAFAGWIRDGRRSVTFENRVVSQGGQVRDMLWTVAVHFDDAGEVTTINSIAHDVTERKRAEAQQRRLERRVQHAQKLESLGLLAGGIAHDFNNLLVSVLGNADLALRDMAKLSPGRPRVEEIKKAAIRASELTGQMLAYSGRGQFVVEPVDVSELVRETGHLLKVSISKNAALRYELADDLPAVEADAAQIRQVVMNLITNASEAVGEEGGTITVRTGIIEVGREYLAATDLGDGLPEGPYLFLEVSDTGRGMGRETRARLFDPFFSTKFTGRGLGLAAVLGIVRGHKGAIRVYSEPGEGTTFKVLLPITERLAGKAPRAAPDGRAEWRGSGTVLVIDDEPTVRNVARMMLERAGLTVLTASDGEAGVELFSEHRDEIDAVLLDLTMPRMNGEETLRRLRRIRKDVPVILSSGYNEQDVTSRFTGDGPAGFIQKPFELEVLVGQFRRVMEPRPAGREEA